MLCGESQWIKFAYAVLVFLFIVFAIVAGSIIYMKIYNDAYEDKDKYKTLIKIGTTYNEMNRAILKEVSMTQTPTTTTTPIKTTIIKTTIKTENKVNTR